MGNADDLVATTVPDVAEFDALLQVGPGDHPGVPVSQPVVGPLDLVAAADLLLEDSVFVPKGVSNRRQRQGRHRIEEARGEAPKTSVAQPGVEFAGLQVLERDPVALERAANPRFELEIEHVVPHRTAQQELDRQEADPLAAELPVSIARIQPAVHQDFTDLRGKGEETIAVRRLVETLRPLHREMAEHAGGDVVDGDLRKVVVEWMFRIVLSVHQWTPCPTSRTSEM